MSNPFALAKDLFFLEDKSLGRKKLYIIGSIEKQISVMVSSVQFKVIQFIHQALKDQPLSDEEVERMVMDKLACKVNMDELKSYLNDMGLTEESQNRVENSELKMLGVSLFSIKIDRIPKLLAKASYALSFSKWLEPALVLLSLAMVLVNLNTVILNSRNHFFSYNDSSIQGALISSAISMVIITIHELAHVFEAVRQKMTRLEFSVSLYLGFMPMYYSKYPEMIALDRKRKLAILFAGLRTNIVMAAVALALMGLPGMSEGMLDLCGIIFLTNFHFITLNLSPFIMNDGYFMLINLLGITGLRTRMWQFIRGIIRRRKVKVPQKNKLLFYLYLITNLITLGISLSITISWLVKIIREALALL